MLSNSLTTSVNFATSSSSIAAAMSYPPGLKKMSVSSGKCMSKSANKVVTGLSQCYDKYKNIIKHYDPGDSNQEVQIF